MGQNQCICMFLSLWTHTVSHPWIVFPFLPELTYRSESCLTFIVVNDCGGKPERDPGIESESESGEISIKTGRRRGMLQRTQTGIVTARLLVVRVRGGWKRRTQTHAQVVARHNAADSPVALFNARLFQNDSHLSCRLRSHLLLHPCCISKFLPPTCYSSLLPLYDFCCFISLFLHPCLRTSLVFSLLTVLHQAFCSFPPFIFFLIFASIPLSLSTSNISLLSFPLSHTHYSEDAAWPTMLCSSPVYYD